ncbi:NADPH-dependent pterin aldehyde reductase [Rosa chinensis]|uniref:NADPH-dependent pterin aldehyde reductase n=1 Tax=Rosa chinensis TaxID=74649 RepID=UPI000D097A57|nr:NADPH-dependent pterin aldehyde reductase [Rosa chinensis]
MNVVASKGAANGSRTVLITGVSKGLGLAFAVEMAKRGHTVIGCSRSQDKLTSLQSELSDKHLFLSADVSSNSGIQELDRVVMEKKGVPDIIINNAGVINNNNKLWEVPAEEFDSIVDTNVKGVTNVLRHFIPLMLKRDPGLATRIIFNISSSWGRSGAAHVAPYCASKCLTRSVAKELPKDVAIMALNLGVIHTDMLVSCFGPQNMDSYPEPQVWAVKAATMILHLTPADNGASLII